MKIYKDIKEAFAHPNHKKLDANGNGKVDAHDFKLLRKKKHEASETPAQEKQEDYSMKEAVGGFASHYSKSEKDTEVAGDHKGEKEPAFRSKSPKRSGFSALDKFKASQADPVKQACDIAKQHGGNMNGSIDKIEKIKKGLSKHPKVQAALQLANESFELTESSWPAKGESMKTTATMTKNKDGSTTTAFPDGTWKIESKGYKAEKKPTNLVYTHAKSDVAYQNLVYKKGGMDNYQLNKEEVEELGEATKALQKQYDSHMNKYNAAPFGSDIAKHHEANALKVLDKIKVAKGVREEVEIEEASVFDQARKTVADDEKKGVDSESKFKLMMTKAKNSQRAAKALANESLDEAKKEPMEVYHTGYSAALQHAEKHLNKQGYDIHPDDWQQHISHGPSKPSEGKTVQLHVPLHKDGVKSKKVAHIQVYNRGNTIPKNNELNMYVN